MFTELQPPKRKRWNLSSLASFGLHCAVLIFLIHRAASVSVTPSYVDHGVPGSSGSISIVYLAPVGPERTNSTPQEPGPSLRVALTPTPKPPKPQAKAWTTDRPTQQN